uniref:SCP domain-containing protein n=1 Tax=Strongyloides venezuelensis TaxID=75913 RepID=A0A0K0FT84_STRVS
MRIVGSIYLVTILLLYFDLTSQWAKFYYRTRYRVANIRDLPIYLCQFEICTRILKMKNITVPIFYACYEMLKAYRGTGHYYGAYGFYYIEIYSKVLTYKMYNHYVSPDKGAEFYIGDCACTDYKCTKYSAVCIYTYWFGYYVWGNHEMC